MKTLIAIIVLAVLGTWGYMSMGPDAAVTPESNTAAVADTQQTGAIPTATQSALPQGAYTVIPAESVVNWSARKPLIDGYVNSGTIGVTEGTIVVGATSSTGSFTIDMNTLHVGLTAKKPGKEGALEGHLKKPDFFDVEKYPTASFVITSTTAGTDGTPNAYTIKGDLTMKGITNTVEFPAKIMVKDGKIYTEASTEIDRTKWGITFGSGSFFQNLANNVVDDMVKLSFAVVAEKAK